MTMFHGNAYYAATGKFATLRLYESRNCGQPKDVLDGRAALQMRLALAGCRKDRAAIDQIIGGFLAGAVRLAEPDPVDMAYEDMCRDMCGPGL